MAYGFNLGQIEGLDSSVETVTLTIANATESNTYTLTYFFDGVDEGWAQGSLSRITLNKIEDDVFLLEILDFTESDVGDVYNVTLSISAVDENFKSAVETVLVDNGLISAPETLFDGTITITAEDVEGVVIPFDKDISAYPLKKWTVTINGLEIPYQEDANGFMLEVDNIGYGVFDNNGVRMLSVVNIQDENYPPVPGDYQVKITGVSERGDTNEILIIFGSGMSGPTCNFTWEGFLSKHQEFIKAGSKPILRAIQNSQASGDGATSYASRVGFSNFDTTQSLNADFLLFAGDSLLVRQYVLNANGVSYNEEYYTLTPVT